MSEDLIIKRLHVSGLTPAITPETLSQRLGSFGTVQALDGFGQVDALGQPRKFAYVTIETTRSKLARCRRYFYKTKTSLESCSYRYEPSKWCDMEGC